MPGTTNRIGAAFTAIVKSMVGDLINPIISLFTGGIDFSGLGIVLRAGDDGAVFAYGYFIMAVINFMIIAFVVFMLVRSVNKIKDAFVDEEEVVTAPLPDPGPSELEILIEIRDALAK